MFKFKHFQGFQGPVQALQGKGGRLRVGETGGRAGKGSREGNGARDRGQEGDTAERGPRETKALEKEEWA